MGTFGTIKVQGRCVAVASLMLAFCGCQAWTNMKARFAPAPPTPASVSIDSEAPAPLTKAQKLDMQMAIARSYENDGNLDQAIPAYADVIKKDPKRVEAYHRLAIVYDLKGQPEKSRGYYQDALKLAPKDANICCDFGYSCYLQRNWGDAERNFRRALELNPEFARAHINLGLMLARNYHTSQALGEFAKAGLDEAAARSNLALAMAQEDRFAEAQEQYEKALAADPNSRAAKMGLAAVQGRASSQAAAAQARASQPAATQAQPMQAQARSGQGDSPIFADTKIGTVPQAQPPMPAQTAAVVQAPAPVQAMPPMPAQMVSSVPTQLPPPMPAELPPAVAVQSLPPVETQTPVVAQAPAPVAEQMQAPPPAQAQSPMPVQAPSPGPLEAQNVPPAETQLTQLPPVQTQVPLPVQAELSAPLPPQTLPVAETQAPLPMQAEMQPPAPAPAAPEEEVAPMPPAIARPAVQAAYRPAEEASPGTRRL